MQSVSDVTTGQMGKELRESRLVSLLSRRASTRELSGSQSSPLLTLHCMFIVQAWEFWGAAEPFHWSPHSSFEVLHASLVFSQT